MEIICPFYQKECITTKCVMWEDECLLISFLHKSKEISKKTSPEEIKSSTIDVLTDELLQFTLKELEEIPDLSIYDINELFWLNKNIEKYTLSGEIKAKIKKIEIIVKDKLEHYDRKEIDDLEDDISEEEEEDSFEEVVTSLSDLVIKKKAPEILRNPSPEELAETIVSYTNEKFPQMDVSLNLAIESYLESIGYKRYNLPIDIRVKIENTEKFIIEKLNEKKLIAIFPEILNEDYKKLANKLIEITKNRYPYREDIAWGIGSSFNDLLFNNKINFSSLSSKNKSVLEKAKKLAKEIIDEEEKNKKDKLREEEKITLTPTIDLFFNWAKKHGFSKVTLADTNAFLFQTGIVLSYESTRNLYASTNVLLRRKVQEDK